MKTLGQQVKERISTEEETPLFSYIAEIEKWFSKLKDDISVAASVATSGEFYFNAIILDNTYEITECMMHNAIEALFDSLILTDSDGRQYINRTDIIQYKKTLWKRILGIPEIDPNRIYATPTSLELKLKDRYEFGEFIKSNVDLYTEYNKFIKWIENNECVCKFKILPVYGRGEYHLGISVQLKEETT